MLAAGQDRLEAINTELTSMPVGLQPVDWNAGAFIDAIREEGVRNQSAVVMTLSLSLGLWFFASIDDSIRLALMLAFFALVFTLAGVLALQVVLRGLNPLATVAMRQLIQSPGDVVAVEAKVLALHLRTAQGERKTIRVAEPLPLRQFLLSMLTDVQHDWNDVLKARFGVEPTSVRPSAMQRTPEQPAHVTHAGDPVEHFRWLRVARHGTGPVRGGEL